LSYIYIFIGVKINLGRECPKLKLKYHSNILLVDDNPTDLEFIKKAFKRCGEIGSIQSVNGGLQAIAYMMGEGIYSDRAKYPYPSFIVTDLKMPDGDGLEVLEHLKANPLWAIIPTIVLTSIADPDDIRSAYMLGASSYHVKPIVFNDLCSLIKIIHDYWLSCEIPLMDTSGKQLPTMSEGKLGERFPQPIPSSIQMRVNN